ncbi:haloacid dehalogenase type II [Fuscovulum ytuae]|jgi:2-haloacid dehalogenase|uniref:(S)-2-haloacid dehalogenase n=1 Tax=Fuscovulum ytuae TaxID=3042299 RepID=A0ABY8Q675_9RHOB|nr:haloacid dehalogenase type II [Fuscovulum sp. YMD61]WGV16363.1 haloacid dehalogenase type II [Fuscovulum sp. YMD61]
MALTTVVFDAYGTLFDVTAAARRAGAGNAALAQSWPALAENWRRKQLEYSWLRTISGAYADFATVTADALDWAMEAQGLNDPDLREELLALYDALDPFPEVAETLARLSERGMRLAILSNGSPAMLASAVNAAGLSGAFEAVLSVDSLRMFKPQAAVYALVGARLGTAPQQVLFASSNGWDIAGAARFGFHTAWVNRAAAPQDRLPQRPMHEIPDLTHLPRLIP